MESVRYAPLRWVMDVMDGKELLPLVGVALGWGLQQITSWRQRMRDRQHRVDDLRLSTYAEWMAGMEARFNEYARRQGSPTERHDVSLCEKRLLLLERDPAIRKLVAAVHAAFPNHGSEEQTELEMMAHGDPEWDWPPFRDAMNALLEHARRSLA
jgi:hypothetical protein